MVYSFVDVTAGATPSMPRSTESLALDGVYLEDVVSGFRVLYTRGREALSPEIETLTVRGRDGDVMQGQRWPSRTIVVGYQLLTESETVFRNAYNLLARLIKGKHNLIFADEDDKFFRGTFSGIDKHEAGTNNVVGEMSFLCHDPFKYGLQEHSAITLLRPVECADGVTRNLRVFPVTYNGTVPAHPVFKTVFFDPVNDADEEELPSGAGECGYIAFLDQDGHILQFGDPDEKDGTEHESSQMLVDKSFANKDSWTAKARRAWKINSGYTDPNVTPDGTVGSVYSKSVSAEDQAAEAAGTLDGLRYLAPTSYGTNVNAWHGPSISIRLPVDSAQERGAADWRLYFRVKFGASNTIQIGMLRVVVTASNGSVIATATIAKQTNAKSGVVAAEFGERSKGKTVDLSYYNQYFGASKNGNTGRKTCTVTKTGASVEFDLGGLQFSFKDSSLASVKADRVTFIWSVFGDEEPVSRCGIYNVRFTKLNCSTWKNTPNKFGTGDVLEVDTAAAEILLNDVPSPDLGAFGNDWETMVLVPGEQIIIESRSSWCPSEYRPTSSLYWREVFL